VVAVYSSFGENLAYRILWLVNWTVICWIMHLSDKCVIFVASSIM
jgi:hypothetical protein